MISQICTSCGGNLILNEDKSIAKCMYCGREYLVEVIKDGKMNIVSADKIPEIKERSTIHEVSFITDKGAKIIIDFPFVRFGERYDTYFSDSSLCLHYKEQYKEDALRFKDNASKLRFPNTRMKELMHYYIPEVKGLYTLDDGSVMVAVNKLKWIYPLDRFGKIDVRYVCFIISRLENLACIYEFNNTVPTIEGTENILVDPKHHQVMIYEGFERSTKDVEGFLKMIREIGKDITDTSKEPLRKSLNTFFESAPKSSALSDFEWWDECLDKAFEKREFIEWSVSEREIF